MIIIWKIFISDLRFERVESQLTGSVVPQAAQQQLIVPSKWEPISGHSCIQLIERNVNFYLFFCFSSCLSWHSTLKVTLPATWSRLEDRLTLAFNHIQNFIVILCRLQIQAESKSFYRVMLSRSFIHKTRDKVETQITWRSFNWHIKNVFYSLES